MFHVTFPLWKKSTSECVFESHVIGLRERAIRSELLVTVLIPVLMVP